jgi:hypothetical protein
VEVKADAQRAPAPDGLRIFPLGCWKKTATLASHPKSLSDFVRSLSDLVQSLSNDAVVQALFHVAGVQSLSDVAVVQFLSDVVQSLSDVAVVLAVASWVAGALMGLLVSEVLRPSSRPHRLVAGVHNSRLDSLALGSPTKTATLASHPIVTVLQSLDDLVGIDHRAEAQYLCPLLFVGRPGVGVQRLVYTFA